MGSPESDWSESVGAVWESIRRGTGPSRRQVLDEIRPDIDKFLKHFGRPPDYWGDLS